MNADVRREARHAALGQLLVAEGDEAAHRRGGPALRVEEAGPHREGGAVRQLDEERPQPALVPPLPFKVLEDAGLGVAHALDLKQRRGPAALVPRPGLAHHQPPASRASSVPSGSSPWVMWCSWSRASSGWLARTAS